VSQKNIPDIFSYNSRKHRQIFIVFSRNITKKASSGRSQSGERGLQK